MKSNKKKLYIIRHGQTDYNKNNIVQGRGINADLNAEGIAQGEAFYEMYKDVPFDKLYTSTLVRTHQTTKKFIDSGLAWEQLPGLDEMFWGDSEGKCVDSEIKDEFASIINAWNSGDYDVRPKGGECPGDVCTRQQEALKHILSKENEHTVLICMHGRAIRFLLCQLTKKPLSEMDYFPHQNTSLYIVNYEDGNYEIEVFNSLEHLKVLK